MMVMMMVMIEESPLFYQAGWYSMKSSRNWLGYVLTDRVLTHTIKYIWCPNNFAIRFSICWWILGLHRWGSVSKSKWRINKAVYTTASFSHVRVGRAIDAVLIVFGQKINSMTDVRHPSLRPVFSNWPAITNNPISACSYVGTLLGFSGQKRMKMKYWK